MKAKKIIMILLIMGSACILASCWDKVELENRGFVNAIGIDKYKPMEKTIEFETDKKDNNRFLVSMSLPSLETLAGKGSEDTKSKAVKYAANETVSAAMRLIDVSSSQKLYFGHTKVATFGKDLLSDEILLREAVDAMERNREISRKLIILAVDGEAKSILEGDIQGEPLVGMFVSNFYKNNSNALALAFRKDLEGLIRELRTTNCAIIPKIELIDKELKLGGAAVIKDFKLIGWLDDEVTRGYLWVKGKTNGAQVTTPFEDAYIPLRVSRTKSDIWFSEENNQLVLHVDLKVKGSVEEYIFSKQTLHNEEKVEELANSFENVISKEIQNTFLAFQKKYELDGFGLKEELKKHHYDLYKKHEKNWEQAYQNMKLTTHIETQITSTGSIK